MKTSIKTKIATATAAILLSTAVFSAPSLAAKTVPLETNTLAPFQKISVKGNVEIILVQRKNIGINYTDDNLVTAKITQQGQNLFITNNNEGLSQIIIYVNDIYRIDAEDNVVVKTDGKLKTQFLQVFLKGNAKADLNTETSSIYTKITDNAQLVLSGSTGSHMLTMGKTPKLTINNFAALKTSITSTDDVMIEKEIAGNFKSANSILSTN